jgi:hypothetical protein
MPEHKRWELPGALMGFAADGDFDLGREIFPY